MQLTPKRPKADHDVHLSREHICAGCVSFLEKPESQIIRRLRFVFDLLFFELSFGFMPEAIFMAYGFSRGLPQLMGALPDFVYIEHLSNSTGRA